MTELFAAIAFYTFGLLSVGGALGMVMARRMVHSALFLVASFVGVAAIFLLAGADFLAGGAGADLRRGHHDPDAVRHHDDPRNHGDPAARQRRPAGRRGAGGRFIPDCLRLRPDRHPLAVGRASQYGPTTEAIGRLLLSSYALPFEMASVLLLVAMVGSILIARED